MLFGKSSVLGLYYHATWPARAVWNWQEARAGRAPITILFYHRVADTFPNDWTISRRQFTRHLAWLQANFDLVSLQEAQERIRTHNHHAAVSITFDDGYAENCDFALPLLIEQRIPCTYFVTLANLVHGRPFPHDRDQPHAPNTIDQLRALAGTSIEIGAHTRTHANLGAITDPRVLRDEVETAGKELAALIGTRVRFFSFPFGLPEHLNREAARLARDAGYEAVCSAYGGYNFPGDDPFHLQRIHADPLLISLKNRLTVDPRKRYLREWQP